VRPVSKKKINPNHVHYPHSLSNHIKSYLPFNPYIMENNATNPIASSSMSKLDNHSSSTINKLPLSTSESSLGGKLPTLPPTIHLALPRFQYPPCPSINKPIDYHLEIGRSNLLTIQDLSSYAQWFVRFAPPQLIEISHKISGRTGTFVIEEVWKKKKAVVIFFCRTEEEERIVLAVPAKWTWTQDNLWFPAIRKIFKKSLLKIRNRFGFNKI
jgi:hypothetical protein